MKFYFFCALLVLSSCTNSNKKESNNQETAILWVNSFKADCQHQGNLLNCLQVQEGELLEEDKWETYYSIINDFDYVPGNLYKLKVSVHGPDPSRSIGDSDAVRYTLIEVIEKKIDFKLRINDLWLLETINGQPIPNDLIEVPVLEVQLSDMTIMGNSSCNNFSGTIELLSNEEIAFGNLASTRMACKDLTLEGEFLQALEKSKFYKIESLKLELLDSTNQLLLTFKKVD